MAWRAYSELSLGAFVWWTERRVFIEFVRLFNYCICSIPSQIFRRDDTFRFFSCFFVDLLLGDFLAFP